MDSSLGAEVELSYIIEILKTQSYMPFENILKYPMFDFQTKITAIAYIRKRLLISGDTGTGKTTIALALAQLIHNESPENKILYIVPLNALEQVIMTVEQGTSLKYKYLDGSTNQNFILGFEDLTIVTYESLQTNFIESFIKNRNQYKTVMIDESASRANNSYTHRIFKSLCDKKYVKYAYLFTATPLRVSPLQFINQINILNPNFIKNPYTFIRKYEIRSKNTGELIGYRNLKDLAKRVGLFYISETRANLKIRGNYKALPYLIEPDIEDDDLTRYNYVEKVKANPTGNSIKYLIRLVKKLSKEGKRGLVYAHHNKVKDLISSKLYEEGIYHGMIDGRKSPKEKTLVQNKFNNGELSCIVFNEATARNLSCDYIIFYELTSDFKQVIGRGERGKEKRDLEIYMCIMKCRLELEIFNERVYQNGLLLEEAATKDIKEIHDIVKELNKEQDIMEFYEPKQDNLQSYNGIILLKNRTLNDLNQAYSLTDVDNIEGDFKLCK